MTRHATFTIAPRGAFRLDQANAFGFGSREAAPGALMRLCFAADDTGTATGVVLRQADDGTVEGTVYGATPGEAARDQVARILSLEHDGTGWDAVGERDRVIGELQARYPGLRPVLFHSPYEAAAWTIISARVGQTQGRRIRASICERLGTRLELEGEPMDAFPAPEALLGTSEPIPALNDEKARRLRGIAEAAVRGSLAVLHLRELGPEAASTELQELRGIGPFAAALIVIRATGFTDVLATEEPLVQRAAAHFYDRSAPIAGDELVALAEAWRPFRTWATVLLRVAGDRAGVTGRSR
jgi:DNA-3-methyladenine glycosylase II